MTGSPKVSATISGVKATAQPSSALSSTGISITMPRTRSGAGRRGLERDVRAERGAADDRLVELEVVEQRDHLLAEVRHRVAPHVARAVRRAVAEQVERDDAVAAVGERLRQRLVHARPEQQPVQQDHRSRTAPVRPVREALSLVPEARHEGRKDIRPLRARRRSA